MILSDKDIKFLSDVKKLQWVNIIGTVAFAIGGICYAFAIYPIYKTGAKLKKHLPHINQHIDMQVETKESLASRYEEVLKLVSGFSDQLVSLGKFTAYLLILFSFALGGWYWYNKKFVVLINKLRSKSDIGPGPE